MSLNKSKGPNRGDGLRRSGGEKGATKDKTPTMSNVKNKVAWRRADALLARGGEGREMDDEAELEGGLSMDERFGQSASMGSLGAATTRSTSHAAGTVRTLDPSTMTKKDVRAIMQAEGEGEASASSLMEGLEKNIRKALEQKRREHDEEKRKVNRLEREIEPMRLRLKELRNECEALGLGEYPDRRERMEPVKEISTKPVFAKRTRLHKMVRKLKRAKNNTVQVQHQGEVFAFMRQRLQWELVEVRQRVVDLEDAKREEEALETELAKRVIKAGEALGNARTNLRELRQRVAHEKELWLGEIKDRATFAEQKKGFESFLQKQVERQRQLEVVATQQKRQKKQNTRRQSLVLETMRMSSRFTHLTSELNAKNEEEARMRAAFRRIGLSAQRDDEASAAPPKAEQPHVSDWKPAPALQSGYGNMGQVSLSNVGMRPAAVVEACRAQEHIRRSLIRKREEEEVRVAALQAKLREAKDTLAETQAEKQRGAHRLLADRETRLAEVTKAQEHTEERIRFLHDAIEPIRLGLQTMAGKLVDLSPSELEMRTSQDVEAVLSELSTKISVILDETRRVQARLEAMELDRPSPTGSRPGSREGSEEPGGRGSSQPLGHAVNMASLPTAGVTAGGGGGGGAGGGRMDDFWNSDMSAAENLYMSNYNIRVEPDTGEDRSLVLYEGDRARLGGEGGSSVGAAGRRVSGAAGRGGRHRSSARRLPEADRASTVTPTYSTSMMTIAPPIPSTTDDPGDEEEGDEEEEEGAEAQQQKQTQQQQQLEKGEGEVREKGVPKPFHPPKRGPLRPPPGKSLSTAQLHSTSRKPRPVDEEDVLDRSELKRMSMNVLTRAQRRRAKAAAAAAEEGQY